MALGDPPEQHSLFVMSVTDMVLESQEWNMILGQLDRDGRKTNAAIDPFMPSQEDTDAAICIVAVEAERRGRVMDALRLFDLAHVSNFFLVFSFLLMMMIRARARARERKREREGGRERRERKN